MSWEPGPAAATDIPDQIEYFRSLKGNLTEEKARIELYKFLRANLYAAAEVLLGVKLLPQQEIAMKMMFKRDFVLGICTRGFSKTTLGGWFAGLYGVFEPGNKILLVGPSFKQSKFLFEAIEKFADQPGGQFFRECFHGTVAHRNDEWSVKLGMPGYITEIRAVPLGMGDKIRGFRANVLVLDEIGSIPPDLVKEVLKPFLAVSKDPQEKVRIMAEENRLIAAGKMKEEERTNFSSAKIISLSSATFKFEDLYKTFQSYIEAILEPAKAKKNAGRYGVFQIGHEALPEGYLDKEIVEDARKTMSESQFAREYGAQFTDDSSGYYSMAQMEACTLQLGEHPTIELVGDKHAAYILSIDPNYKANETSDHFAMCVMRIDETTKKGYVVHNYAVAGRTLKEHIKYLHYILTHFNIVYIIGDSMGLDQVMAFANDNELFKESKIELKYFEAEYDDADQIRKAKQSYNKNNWAIVHQQNFTSGWLTNANQWLQANFQHRKIFFAANLGERDYNAATATKIPIDQIVFDDTDEKYEGTAEEIRRAKMIDLIDTQSQLIRLTKDECALIEVDITPLGNQTFKLPQNVRRTKGKGRARRDSYTALLLVNAGLRYFHMLTETPEENNSTFVPVAFNMF